MVLTSRREQEISEICTLIREAAKALPDMPVCRALANVFADASPTPVGQDLYYVEDDVFKQALKDFLSYGRGG